MHSTATLHALPTCSPDRIFDLRRAAKAAGIKFAPRKLQAIQPTATSKPMGGDAA